MSRPIYEPTLTREDARLGFGNDQLFRRPAPSGGQVIAYAWILFEAFANIPTNTWYNLGNVASPLNLDWFISDADSLANFDIDPDQCSIGWDLPGEYFATAWVLFDDTFIDGNRLSLALNRGVNHTYASFRIANINPVDATGTADVRVPVSSAFWSPNPTVLAPGSVRAEPRHNAGTDRQVATVELTVFRMATHVGDDFTS